MRKDIDADLQLYIPEKLNEDLPVVIVNIDKAEDNEAIHEAVTELPVEPDAPPQPARATVMDAVSTAVKILFPNLIIFFITFSSLSRFS